MKKSAEILLNRAALRSVQVSLQHNPAFQRTSAINRRGFCGVLEVPLIHHQSLHGYGKQPKLPKNFSLFVTFFWIIFIILIRYSAVVFYFQLLTHFHS
jgi:hypothetical protein